MSTQFDIRHDEQVRVLVDIVRMDYLMVKAGTIGNVITMKSDEEGRRHYLVKWKGKSGPVSVLREELERA